MSECVGRSMCGDNMGVLFASSQLAYLEFYYSVENYYAIIMRVEYYWGLGQPMVLLRTGYFMGLIAHACISLHRILISSTSRVYRSVVYNMVSNISGTN